MKKQWLATVAAILISMAALVMLFVLAKGSSIGASSTLLAAPLEVITPTVTAINPASAYNDLDTSVVITGADFAAELSGTLVLTPPTAYLGSIALADVAWVNSTTLSATVPWGMDPGVYTLTVVNPAGETGSLPNAFTVTQGIGVWTSGGPYGGSVFVIAIHPTATSTLFATTHYGLFRSQDRGESWEQVFGDLFAGWIAIDPFRPNTIYLGTGTWGDMAYRSDDRGDTWTAIPITDSHTHGYPATHIFPHPLVEGTVYAAVSQDVPADYEGLYKSEDRGENWVNWSNNLTDTGVTALAFHPTDPQIMYLGTDNGNVFRTEDGGLSWQFIGQPERLVASLAVDPFGEHTLWLCGSAGGTWGGLWKYDGVSWTEITPGVDWENKAYALVFDPHQQGRMWLGTHAGGFTSLDGGQTWAPFAASSHSVISLAVDPDDSQIVYQGYNGEGIYRTLDGGGNWQEVNHGLAGVVPSGLAVQPDNPQVVYALADLVALFKSSNGGTSWRALLDHGGGSGSQPVTCDPFAPQRVVLGFFSGVQISEDGGETWHWLPITSPAPYQDCCRYDSWVVAASPEISGLLVLGAAFEEWPAPAHNYFAGGLAFSTDGGKNWEWADLGREISPVVSLAFDPTSPTVVYAGTRGPFEPPVGNPGELLKSTDGGLTWQSLRQNLGPWSVDQIAVEPGGAHRLFVLAGGIRRSSDGGQTWELMPYPWNGYVRDLIFVPGEPPILYAATQRGCIVPPTERRHGNGRPGG